MFLQCIFVKFIKKIEYLNEIKPNLKVIITDLQNLDTWEDQLAIEVTF